MEKKLIRVDRAKMVDLITSLKNAEVRLNEISKQLKAIGFEKTSIDAMIEGVSRHFKNPKKETVSNWLKELKVKKIDAPKIEGVEISKDKLIEMVEIAGDISKVESAIIEASIILDSSMVIKRYLQLDETGNVSTIENYRKLILEQCTTHTRTQAQNDALGHIESMITSIKALEKIAERSGKGISTDTDSPLFELPYFSRDDNGIIPNSDYILSL
ncbi:hypothetical protein CYCD_26730 [Tenuifilaceae bacterium CYCD]|nr:hypothetical protein CYCD_26730 [Tenuifilaceae bacterium CYCD]